MEEDKISFVLYSDQRGQFDKLSDEQAGKLVKHMFSYVNLEYPEGDFITELAFEPIKTQLKRDKKKWDKTKEGRSKAGKASAEARRRKKEQKGTNPTNVKIVEQTPTNPTVNVNDNVNVTVNDNVNVIDNSINNNKSGLILKNVEIEMLNSSEWIVSVCRNAKAQGLKLSPEQCKEYISRFCIEQQACGELDRPFRELKKHFIHWVITKLKCEPTKKKPNDNQILDV